MIEYIKVDLETGFILGKDTEKDEYYIYMNDVWCKFKPEGYIHMTERTAIIIFDRICYNHARDEERRLNQTLAG